MTKIISVSLLRLTLGLFFLILGIIGLIPNMQESIFSLNDKYGLEIIFGIVEIISGLFLITGLFTFMRRKSVAWASLVVLLFWTARIILTRFIWGIKINNAGIFFIPQFSSWILILSCELVIASALYIIYKAYE